MIIYILDIFYREISKRAFNVVNKITIILRLYNENNPGEEDRRIGTGLGTNIN